MEDVGEEERARRHAKRFAGLCAVKKTPAYIITTLRQRQRPTSPDPYDDRVSKRAWEKSMQELVFISKNETYVSFADWELACMGAFHFSVSFLELN